MKYNFRTRIKNKKNKKNKTIKKGGSSTNPHCLFCYKPQDDTSIIVCENGHVFHHLCACKMLEFSETHDECYTCNNKIFRNILNVCNSSSNLNKGINHLKDNWTCSKESNCHHTIYGLQKILDNVDYSLREISRDNKVSSFKDIFHLFFKKKHYLLYVSAPFHYFYIEIINKKFRIISLWDSKHGIYDYYENGKYGKMQNITKRFMDDFNNLCSNNDEFIIDALDKMFGVSLRDQTIDRKNVLYDLFEVQYE